MNLAVVFFALAALLFELLSPCPPGTARPDPASALVTSAQLDDDGSRSQNAPPRVAPMCPCGCKHKTLSLAGFGLGHDVLLEDELEVPLRFTSAPVAVSASSPPDAPERTTDPVPRPA